jgi:uncharacterized protein (TIGR00730 family)
MTEIRSLAVFCGSRVGNDPAYAEAGRIVGAGMAQLGIRLVFGGGKIGIMGVVADAVLAGGGSVMGVIPRFLREREVAHTDLTDIVITDNMHVRKTRLYEESDAFLVMPGGLGTFDEAFEIITWRQLGLHDKPIMICDEAGWARPFVALIEHAIAQGFASPSAAGLYEVLPDARAVVERLARLPVGTGGPATRM